MTLLKATPKKLLQAVERTLMAGLVPYVQGSPGIGKSDIARQLATKWNLKLIDCRLSTMMPEDLNGLPFRNGDKSAYLPFENFPINGDEVPEGYSGWLILFDELSSAPKSLQAAAYKVILDREVGIHKLHDNVIMMAAGNLKTDKAVVVPMSTAMQSRLVHFEMNIHQPDWVDWADKNSIDYRVKAYINYKPSELWVFNPDHTENTFRCPRTWEFVSRLIKDKPSLDDIDHFTINGAIGESGGMQFVEFCNIASSAPTIEAILNDPENTMIPKEASLRFFVVSAVMDHTDSQNLDKLFTYINRLPEEYQVIYLRGLARKDPKLRTHGAYLKNLNKLLRFISEDEKDEYSGKSA